MFSIAFSSLSGQDSVYRRPAHAEGMGKRARWLAASVHPLRQSGFGLVERLHSPGSPHMTYSTRTSRPARLLWLMALAPRENRRPAGLESLASLCGCLNYCGRTARRQPSVTAELPRAPLGLLHPHPPRSGSAFGLT